MTSSNKSGEVVRGAVNWVGSSIFGLAGTVLLVCWLLAYALEPEGGFARGGLVLALAAYVIDLVREKWASRREQPEAKAIDPGASAPPAAKAA